MKIQKSFEDPIAIVESIVGNAKKVLKKTELQKSELDDPCMKAMDNTLFMEEWKIDFTMQCTEFKKLNEEWVKTYSLIWDLSFSMDVQQAIKEIPDFDGRIRNDPLVLSETIETLMHTP